MKAVTRREFGNPDVLEVKDWERPVPGANEVLVRVHATTVNRTDYHNLTGRPLVMRLIVGFFAPKASIPGTDFAGVIEAVGSRVRVSRLAIASSVSTTRACELRPSTWRYPPRKRWPASRGG